MSIAGIKLPGLLKSKYADASLEAQLKSRFLYYFIISLAAFVVIIAIYFSAVGLVNSYKPYSKGTLLAEIVLLIVISACLFLLLKGHFSLSLNLIIYTLTTVIWLVIVTDTGPVISRVDNLFYFFAIITLFLLVTARMLQKVILYIFANLVLLLVYLNFISPELYANTGTILDLFGDFTFSIVYSGIVLFSIHKLNIIILEKIKSENQEKIDAQEKLIKSELKFFELTDLLPQIVFESDLTGKLNYVNKKGYELFGYTEAEVKTGLTVFQTVIADDIERLKNNVQQLYSSAQSVGNDYTAMRKDGSVFPVIIYSSLIYESEKPIGIRGVIADITSQKKAENELRASELKYGTLVENMNEAIMLVDHEDRVLFVNKKFTEKLGYTSDEIIGKIGYELLVESQYHNIIKKANADRIEDRSGQYEITFTGKQGQKVDFLISGTPIKDETGKLIGSLGNLTDITERKIEERKLLASEERYRKLFEGIPDVVMVSDLKGNIVYANEVLEKTTGITPADYNNPKRAARIHPDDLPLYLGHIASLVSGIQNFTPVFENRFIDAWDKIHWFSGRLAKLEFEDQTYIQTVTRDITEQKQIQNELDNYRENLELLVKERTDELEATNEELTATNDELIQQRQKLQNTLDTLHNTQGKLLEADKMASLGTLSAGIAHEINNPLNYIQGGVFGIEQYIQENLPEHTDPITPILSSIQEGVDRTVRIIKSLSHFSRQNEDVNENVTIQQVIENSLTMLQNEMKHRIDVVKDFNAYGVSIKGNSGKLHQAFLNILSNSSQAIPKNGTIKIETRTENNQIVIVVTDSGMGIMPEILSQIYNPFFTTKDPGKGTGLGLAITYNIIQEHKGSISIASDYGHGTTVTVQLPLG